MHVLPYTCEIFLFTAGSLHLLTKMTDLRYGYKIPRFYYSSLLLDQQKFGLPNINIMRLFPI